jgi:hypothetical protein
MPANAQICEIIMQHGGLCMQLGPNPQDRQVSRSVEDLPEVRVWDVVQLPQFFQHYHRTFCYDIHIVGTGIHLALPTTNFTCASRATAHVIFCGIANASCVSAGSLFIESRTYTQRHRHRLHLQ